MKKLLTAIYSSLFFGVLQLALVGQTYAMSFEQAWQELLANNDSLAANKASVERSEALRDAAKALYYPKIDLTGNYTRLEKPVSLDLKDLEPLASLDLSSLDPALGQILAPLLQLPTVTNFTDQDITTSSIRAIWPLYTGGRRGAAIDIAREQHIEAGKVLAMQQQAKFEDLARIYFGVVLAAQVAETYQEVEDGLRKHQSNALKLEQQGQIAYVERLQADASYDKAKVDTQKALRNYQIAQLALKDLLHSQQTVEPSTNLFTESAIPELEQFMSRTLNSYPGLAILDSKTEQAKKLVTIEKGSYMPEVFMFGNYQLYEGDSLAAQYAPDWMVGVGVSIPLIDNSGRADKVNAAHSTVRQISYVRAQAERDLGLLVEKTYREAELALEEYQGLESSLALAEENLRIRLKAFNQGLATSVDVVDAEMYLASVKTQRQAAAYHHVLALAKLTALSGEMANFSQYYRFNQGLLMRKSSAILPLVPLAIIVAWVGYSFWQAYQPKPQLLQGQIEAQQYNISSKVAGRIDQVLVKKGQQVEPGQLIFTITSPELEAKLEQAKAGQQAASAMAEQAENGARSQEVAAAKDQWQKAQAAAQLAEKTYQRVNNLYQDGVVAEQQRDEAYTQWQAARYTENAASQMYQLAQEGARDETKKAAQEQVRAAAGVVAEVEAFTSDTEVTSWHAGEVSQLLLQSGELAPTGFPVVSIIDMQDAWLVLHVREDQLSQFQKGHQFMARLPALDNQSFKFEVSHVSVMGDFATWRATDSRTGFDLRTFEIEARPLQQIEQLRVGMSAIIELE